MSNLDALAAHIGILPSYVDQTGRQVRVTSDATRVALLAALGIDASTDAIAREALDALESLEAHQLLSPVRVVRESEAWDRTLRFRVPHHAGAGAAPRVDYECTVRDERGDITTYVGTVERGPGEIVDVGLAPLIGLGYYDVHLDVRVRGHVRTGDQRLVIAPSACPMPARRELGIIANLYGVRSERDWGIGTTRELAALAEWSAARGAAFVGINPLHAIRNRGLDISPYAPVSRLYRSVAYLDVTAVPELAESDDARALLDAGATRDAIAALHAGVRVDYERVTALTRPILEALHRTFIARHAGRRDPRDRAYDAYVEREGEPLDAYATFCALEEYLSPPGSTRRPWREWPEAFRTRHSVEVAEFRRARRERVDFHRWLQFELDRQLEHAAARGRAAGLAIGIYQDLAVGSAADGSDAWTWPNLFFTGASLGAPPDDYSAEGQNWGLPVIGPHRLHQDRYAYWIALVRASLRHAGALRIDHVLGLFRQFWIPEGMSGRDGAYVRFPTNDLLGILALESTRQRAVVVGEDLGTVPAEVPPTLREWRVLSSRVMLFERGGDGAFRPAASYEPVSLTTADTHDMTPLAGWWRGRDIELRRELGLVTTAAGAAAARAVRENDRRALLARLAADGALMNGRPPATPAELCGAVHRMLCATPAALVGIALDDLTGETEPVNVPGVGAERFPCWSRRSRVRIEDLDADPGVAAALDGVRRES